MKAVDKVIILKGKKDSIQMKCKNILQIMLEKLKFFINVPIILTGSVKEIDSLWVRDCQVIDGVNINSKYNDLRRGE